MNDLQTITQLTKSLGVSTRTLRYYERIGLLQSRRVEGYAYRVYDEEATARLKQIILLRKLRVPLKQIAQLLRDDGTVNAIELFMQNIDELDDEITSLSTIRDILQALVDKLRESASVRIGEHLLSDRKIMALMAPLNLNKFALKEADEKLNKLKDRDVRIVYLPPATVAAAYAQGTEPGPELETADIVDKFIAGSGLANVYPASRHYGFNNPDEPVHGEGHGYERYITIPDDMEVPAPLVKKRFVGGVYAAYTIPMGEWDAWLALHAWVVNSDRYDFRWYTIEGVSGWTCGWIEEHLNYWNWHASGESKVRNEDRQIDLLIPIQEKNA